MTPAYEICEGWTLRAIHLPLWVESWQVVVSGQLPYKGMGRLYEREFEKEFPGGTVPVHLNFAVDKMYRESWQLTGGDYVSRGKWQLICLPDFIKQVPEEVRLAAFGVLLTLPQHMQPPKHMHP